MNSVNDQDALPADRERPWIVLTTTFDVESWIDHLNWDLQRFIGSKPVQGAGVCFRLEAGGELYLHTNSDGDVLLDLTPDAEWVAPVITAATQVAAPASQFWLLPGHLLTQLILGLTTLIATTRLVREHAFSLKKNRQF